MVSSPEHGRQYPSGVYILTLHQFASSNAFVAKTRLSEVGVLETSLPVGQE